MREVVRVKGQPRAWVGPWGHGVGQSGSRRAYEEFYKNSFHPQHNLHQVTSIVPTFQMAKYSKLILISPDGK